MTEALTRKQSQALQSAGGSMEVFDPSTNRVYVVVDRETHQRAIRALEQQEDDWNAIQEGITQADAGETMSLDEAERRIREGFGFDRAS